jgi:hypothetical protein
VSTVTEAPPRDFNLVSKPDDSLVYMSRRVELRLTMKARYPVRNTITGQPEGMTSGIFCGFRGGVLRVPREGMVNLVDTLDGGEFEIEAEKVHDWLGKHRLNGNRTEGFWVLETPAPPVTAEEINRLVQAATDWNVELLEEVIAQETAGWGREDVLRVAQGSIDRIRAMEERVQAEAQAAVSDDVLAAQNAAKEAEERAERLERELENARREQEGDVPVPPEAKPQPKGKAK